ncbi:MAG: carbohydrate ABC transporter permease [Gaiellaceae bacterium MAG52_C11]|nr:carbohydrate ABC transporter permease [Candidatus Gaiellasilicea maunaloa]
MDSTLPVGKAPTALGRGLAARVFRIARVLPIQVGLAAVAVLWMLPTVGLLLTSLLARDDFNSIGWWKIFTEPSLATFENYRALFANHAITSSLVTTTVVAVGGTILPLLIAAAGAYAFAWLDFPGRDWLFVGLVGLMVVPVQMALIPIFQLYNVTGLFDTAAGLILFHTAFGLPFATFLLRNYMIGIPGELLDAARIDGASELRVFLWLILPLAKPALASLAVFQFLWVWNDLLVALVFGRRTQPITVAIFTQLSQFDANIAIISTGAFVSLVVPLTVFLAFQRYFVRGLLAGAVK